MAGDLWMSEARYGPKIRGPGQVRETFQTYLTSFIDDATRLIPFATFTFSEGAIAYLIGLEQALRRRGLPERLHVDNGARAVWT